MFDAADPSSPAYIIRNIQMLVDANPERLEEYLNVISGAQLMGMAVGFMVNRFFVSSNDAAPESDPQRMILLNFVRSHEQQIMDRTLLTLCESIEGLAGRNPQFKEWTSYLAGVCAGRKDAAVRKLGAAGPKRVH